MAAPRIHCHHCGEIFDRRQVTTAYCPKPDCQREHLRQRVEDWRASRKQIDEHRIQKWTAA